MSYTLAVSTSDRCATVAVLDGMIPIADRTSDGGSSHSSAVGVLLEELMLETSLSVRDIDMLAVDTGPGSFTGVRIGVSFMNGMALALDKPIIPVSSLLALRYGDPDSQYVASIIDARNGSVYAALFDNDKALIPPIAIKATDFIGRIPDGAVCVGSGVAVYKDSIMRRVNGAKLLPDPLNEVTAVNVGLAAVIQRRNHVDLSVRHVEPTYLRLSQAERMRGIRVYR